MRRTQSPSFFVLLLRLLFSSKKSTVQTSHSHSKATKQRRALEEVIELTPEELSSWNLKLLMRLDWHLFEELTCQLFRLLDYKAELTPHGADNGIDVILFNPGEFEPYAAVQCKSWTNRIVGVKEIRELLGSKVHGNYDHAIFVTTNIFSDEARRVAFDSNIGLMDGPFFLETLLSLEPQFQKELLDKTLEGDCFTPTCPSCGTKMTLRSARQGSKVGSHFYGCRSYPKCRNTFQIAKPPKIEKLMTAEKPWLHPDSGYMPNV
jgi:restriction system protein